MGSTLAQALALDSGPADRAAARRAFRLLPGHGRPPSTRAVWRRSRICGKKLQRTGRSGGRDHGDEGDAAAPADVFAQARGLRCAGDRVEPGTPASLPPFEGLVAAQPARAWRSG